MRLDELFQRMLDQVEQEQRLARRVALFVAPPLLFVLAALGVIMALGWWQFAAAMLGVLTLVVQFDFFTRPAITRTRQFMADLALYLSADEEQVADAVEAGEQHGLMQRFLPLVPALLATLLALLVFVPTLLRQAAPWQQLLGVAFALGLLLVCAERLLRSERVLRQAHQRLSAELATRRIPRRVVAPAVAVPGQPRKRPPDDGLLDPATLARLDAQPMPVLRLSPGARAWVRTEGYLLLRDRPTVSAEELREAMHAWASLAHTDEADHWALPAVGGKVYLPCAAHGILARSLSATARRLGMDGAYSATLNTWLVRLPPARSYAVAARLIDSLMALGMLPPGATLIHHLTVAGDLGADSTMPALLHLLSTPLIFEARPGHAVGDERTFIMRGGGVMDDLDRGGRTTGARTDFVDGFLFVDAPGMDSVEQIAAHAVNLRLKQLLSWAIYTTKRPPERRTPAENGAALRYAELRADTLAFLERYELAGALSIPWLDGRWSEQWFYIKAISDRKQASGDFLDQAQTLRDEALDDLEELALRAAGQGRRAA
ncbi:MAG: hypothetical protein MUD01_02005 [Chloroflexaceae bacterium]|jgi:hypothetical protein|nr:hypothetical protein [Chloroflexaceae bacterium]